MKVLTSVEDAGALMRPETGSMQSHCGLHTCVISDNQISFQEHHNCTPIRIHLPWQNPGNQHMEVSHSNSVGETN